MTSKDDISGPRVPPPQTGEALFVRRVLIVALIATLIFALWRVSLVLILIFGGIVVAVALRNIAAPLARYLRLPDRVALIVTTLGLGAIAIAFFFLFGSLASQQLSALIDQIPGALESARDWLNGSSIGRSLLAAVGQPSEATLRLLGALPLAGGILGGVGEAVLMIVVGIYFAANPSTYLKGLIRLLPQRRRARAREILDAMSKALQNWLIGMTLDMLLLGVMTWFGMWLIGVPLPIALAVLSGVAVFVPYIGPLLATIPGLLLALSVSPTLALEAGIVYLVVLTIEGNISQPLLQRWTVSLPPVVNLLAILVFSPLFGIWGAVLATPLAVVLSVLVQMVYVEDILEDRAR
jgi:predicted PurR-regulated permease PerM